MSLIPKRPVKRRKDGTFEVNLTNDQREVFAHTLQQLRELLLSDDPLLKRLFPPAYVDDPDRDKEYQQLMKGDLLESRFAAIETMEATLAASQVDEAELTRWMQAVNSLRLVVGTRLDVSEVLEPVDPEDPDYGLHVLYEVLGWLLDNIVVELSATLPPPTGDDNAPS